MPKMSGPARLKHNYEFREQLLKDKRRLGRKAEFIYKEEKI